MRAENEYENESAAASCRKQFGALVSDGAMIDKSGLELCLDRKFVVPAEVSCVNDVKRASYLTLKA